MIFMKEKWEIKKLGDCFDVIRNGASIKQYDNADGYPITRIETLSNDLFNRDRLGYANIYEIEKYKNFLLKDNDILISHINSTKYLGRAVLYKKQENEKIIHGMNLLNLSGINSNISPDYISYYFKTESYKIQIFKITKKAVNQASFTTTALKEISIPIPPLSVQKSIVAELDTLHRLKELQEQQLTEFDNLAQSTFYSLFGDPIDNEKGWEVGLLRQVTTKIGSGATPLGGNQNYKTEGISLIRSLNVHNGQFLYKDLAFIDENQAKLLDNVIVKANDVLINITGASVARSCIVPNEILPARVNQHVSIIRLKENLNCIFVNSLFISESFQEKLLSIGRANGATREAITKSQLENLTLPIPPLSLQTAFAERIEKIKAQKELVKRSIGETQTLIDYTMDKYFG